MREQYFGSLSGTQLHLRWFAPYFPFNFRNWFRRDNWDAWAKFSRDCNGRCYCPVGWLFRGRIELAGFGLCWWLSRYGGEVPCACDDVMAELFGDAETEV